jgi:hypothetical protein
VAVCALSIHQALTLIPSTHRKEKEGREGRKGQKGKEKAFS